MSIFTVLLGAILLAFGGQSGAQGLDLGSVNYGSPAAGGTLVGGAITVANPPGFTRVVQVGASSGEVVVRDGIKVRVGASDVDMVLQRKMPWQQVARAAAAIGRTLPYVATGVAFVELMDELRLRSNGSAWNQDPGTPQVSATGWSVQDPGCTGLGSPSAATQCGFNIALNNFAQNSTIGVRQLSSPTGPDSNGNWRISYEYCQKNTGTGALYDCSNQSFVRTPSPTTQMSCPASVDALNPANSVAAGLAPGYDGKCKTGRYTDPKSETQAGDIAIANGAKAGAVAAVGSMLGRGVDLAPRTDTPTASGPASVAQPGTTTTTTGPGGTTTGTSSPTTIITYNGPSYTWNDSTVVTTTNGGGTTTTTTTAPPAAQVETCGLPGKPACKIDETGTPPMPPVVDPTVGQIADDAARRTAADAQLTDPAFGWFSAPPVVSCTPFEWPGGFSLDPCGPMEIVRSIMAYLWAIFAAWWSFGMVRRTIAGS